ncbi:MAG: arginine decarboxylase, pyruvoyl-dependent [Thermoplasmata archaeon]
MLEGGSHVPKKVFFVKGVGKHKERLTSFEMALRDAGIEKFNLVRVSSILPPHCKLVSKEEGLKELQPGQIVYVVMSECAGNEPNRLIAASIGASMPLDSSAFGYLSEHHAFGQNEQMAGDYAEDLAAYMLASMHGIQLDMTKDYDEQKDIFTIGGKPVKTRNITQSAVCDKNGLWTTAIAAAVFIL